MLIWRGGGQAPLEVAVTLDNAGAGWFALERYTAAGAYEPLANRTDGDKVDGDAFFAFSLQQLAPWGWAPLSLRIKILAGNPAANAMNVYLRVAQPAGLLSPEDAQGNAIPMQQNGVLLGPLTANKPTAFDFLILFW